MVIDGYSLLFRAFYGTRYLSTSDGRPTNAHFGFVSMLFQLFENVQPDAMVVALDAPGNTFRHDDYAEYKGTRRETPSELEVQLRESRAVISAFNIPVLEVVGYEADDVIGTVSRLGEENGYDTTIVTGDLDSLQLVDECVTVMTTRKGVTDVVMYTPEAVRDRYGFGPELVPDYKALVGDTSDNIKGVPGIGEKTATILIREFGGIEEIIARLGEVPEKFRKKLVGMEEQMQHSKWLATIVRDVPLSFDFAPYRVTGEHLERATQMLTELEFRSQVRRLGQVMGPYLSGDVSGFAGRVEVRSEALEARLVPERAGYRELSAWIGRAPFAVVPPFGPAQGSLLDDPVSKGGSGGVVGGDAYVAVGKVVRRAPFEDVLRVFGDRPGQVMALDTKGLWRSAARAGIGVGEGRPFFDATLGAYVLQSGRSAFDLGEIAAGYLDITAPTAGEDLAVALVELEGVMRERLSAEGQTGVLDEIELPLVPILAEMEAAGILVSGEQLLAFGQELQVEIDRVQEEVWRLAGEEFNIGSPKQIGEVLFERLALPGGKKTKTGWATGVEILGEMAAEHPVAGAILSYRELTKLKNTYADALPKLVQPDGRIHTTFNQAVAATGRLSSNEPNLQNIPIRTELGRTIRRAFHAPAGMVLGSYDYSQIELRILADMCGDEMLVRAFSEGEDVHTVTAALMYHIEEGSVTKEQRRLAKLLNYAVLYGVTGFGLAAQLGAGFGVEEANALIAQYNERFPKVKAFTEGMVEQARAKGFTVTKRGRRRYFPDIHAGNRNTRSYAERQAMNAPIQGTAADMIKLAMVDVAKLMKGRSSRMLLQVHDELVFECGEDFGQVRVAVREAMERALPLNVPLEVDMKFGENWLEMG